MKTNRGSGDARKLTAHRFKKELLPDLSLDLTDHPRVVKRFLALPGATWEEEQSPDRPADPKRGNISVRFPDRSVLRTWTGPKRRNPENPEEDENTEPERRYRGNRLAAFCGDHAITYPQNDRW